MLVVLCGAVSWSGVQLQQSCRCWLVTARFEAVAWYDSFRKLVFRQKVLVVYLEKFAFPAEELWVEALVDQPGRQALCISEESLCCVVGYGKTTKLSNEDTMSSFEVYVCR